MEKICLVCSLPLEGRKRKFCSLKCKLAFINNKHQNYATQQRRGYERKAQLINMKGGKCQICGYNKNQSALCFHHTDPKIKSFQIDIRKML
jgi:predicted Zn-ribbon and HTH transcriptional regulator